MWLTFYLLVVVFLVSLASSSPVDHVAIQTTSGPINGFTVEVHEGKKVTAYLGIPYAEPPIGELRFRPPQPLTEPRAEVLEANKIGPACFQSVSKSVALMLRKFGMALNRPQSEDCLYLNVWVPEQALEKAPVMVYIHGGAFVSGHATSFFSNGGYLSAQERVIVVSMNYRLGVFGFLKLSTPEAPGNMGLMDQQLALRWVHDNIATFGGDPNSVTIFGLSAGSASVGFQLLSKGSEGLFQRAIMMSGAPNNRWAYRHQEEVKVSGNQVIDNLGYRGSLSATEDVLKFLKSRDPKDLNEAYDSCAPGGGKSLSPTLDDVFLTTEPLEGITARDHDVPLMIGHTDDEGVIISLMHHQYLSNDEGIINWSEYNDLVESVHPEVVRGWKAEALAAAYADITRKGDLHALRDAFSRLIGDYNFACGIDDFAARYSQHNTVYRYIYGGVNQKYRLFPISWGGTSHGEDNPVLFGIALANPNSPPEMKRFSKEIMKYYANFARTGNPNLGDSEAGLNPEDTVWPTYEVKKRSTKILRMVNETIVQHPVTDRCSIFHILKRVTELLVEKQ